MMKITGYDNIAFNEIQAWKNPNVGWPGRIMKTVNLPLEKTGDLVLSTPVIGTVINKSIQGLTGVCNDVAQWSVQKEAIYGEFRKAGHNGIKHETDVFNIELENIDRIVGWLALKYKGVALTEGAGTGMFGLPGIPVDLAALITLNLRAIGEYATYYGFNIHAQEERLYAMNVLGLASSPSDATKVQAMAQLTQIAREVAQKRTWKELEKHAFVQVIQRISKSLGIRLTKAKLAQVIPAAGAVVGGGYNAYFTSRVCDAAYYLYRERFLARKYGPDIISDSEKTGTRGRRT